MSTIPYLQLRDYTPEDYPMLCWWWNEHGAVPAPRNILPKLGIIIEEHKEGADPTPQAAMFLYMDNSTGVGFLEHGVTAPGLSLQKAQKALRHGVRFLKESANKMGYFFILTHAIAPIARFLRSEGFKGGDANLIRMGTLTE
jgi:hypothetical protein